MPTPAENYEAFMVPPFFAPWADQLAARARPAPGAAILDVGCGTGIVARRLAPRGRRPRRRRSTRGRDARGGARRRRPRGARDRVARGRGRAPAVPGRRVRPRDLPVRADVLRRPRRGAGRDAAGAPPRRPAGLSVFQAIERHPFYVALDRAIRARLGASGVGEIFALGDAAALAAAIGAAGFRDVALEAAEHGRALPRPGRVPGRRDRRRHRRDPVDAVARRRRAPGTGRGDAARDGRPARRGHARRPGR